MENLAEQRWRGAARPKLVSPCQSCPRRRQDKDECAGSCQQRVNYLHVAFGDPWYDVEKRIANDKAELDRIILAENHPNKCNFRNPESPNARHFDCPICKQPVSTSHRAQRTCAAPICKRLFERDQDAARRERNKERRRNTKQRI